MKIRHRSDQKATKRVCIFSQRYLSKEFFRCANYEFEDIINQIDEVDLVAPVPDHELNMKQRCLNRISNYIKIMPYDHGAQKVQLKKEYDLFFVMFTHIEELKTLELIESWKKYCKTSAAFLTEVWVKEIAEKPDLIKRLSKFDYIFIYLSSSVRPLQEAISKPCFQISPGIDTIRFCPVSNAMHRCIDVYSMGRKDKHLHEKLLEISSTQNIFYLFDTYEPKNVWPVKDHREHRQMTSNLLKRSQFFIVNPAKMDQDFETGRQIEIGPRYFEGCAPGTIMIGNYPNNEIFTNNFSWPDSVIQIPENYSEIGDFLFDLKSQSDRLRTIQKNNIRNSLLRHDWVYRWIEILNILGMKLTPEINERVWHLKKLAEKI